MTSLACSRKGTNMLYDTFVTFLGWHKKFALAMHATRIALCLHWKINQNPLTNQDTGLLSNSEISNCTLTTVQEITRNIHQEQSEMSSSHKRFSVGLWQNSRLSGHCPQCAILFPPMSEIYPVVLHQALSLLSTTQEPQCQIALRKGIRLLVSLLSLLSLLPHAFFFLSSTNHGLAHTG